MTRRERLIRAFGALGMYVKPTRSRKYFVFTGSGETYYIGRSGALRRSRRGTIEHSLSLTDTRMYNALLLLGEQTISDPAAARIELHRLYQAITPTPHTGVNQ